MNKLLFNANLNLKSEPNELIIKGIINTSRDDDGIVIEKANPQGIIDMVLLLKVKITEGKEPKKETAKPFIFLINDESAKNYSNVTIFINDNESHTELVKIIG